MAGVSLCGLEAGGTASLLDATAASLATTEPGLRHW